MEQYCPNGCHITDRGKTLCPRCGAFMKQIDSKDREKVLKDIGQMQSEGAQDLIRGRYAKTVGIK